MSATTAERSFLSSRVVVASVGTIAIADLLLWRLNLPYAVKALLDEPAHAATGLIGLAALDVAPRRPVILAVLAGSVLIDADHVPLVLGSHILQRGVPRPYTHSLGTILVLVLVALLLRNRERRQLTLIVAAAMALHFLRDCAEPEGPGVSLLWPLSNYAFVIGYPWYAGGIGALASVAIIRRRRAKVGVATVMAAARGRAARLVSRPPRPR